MKVKENLKIKAKFICETKNYIFTFGKAKCGKHDCGKNIFVYERINKFNHDMSIGELLLMVKIEKEDTKSEQYDFCQKFQSDLKFRKIFTEQLRN